MDANNYVYEVQATNLRPLIVRVLVQNLLKGLREDDSDSAYKVMVELDRPFSALLLEEVSFKTYQRVASSHLIVARADDSKRLFDSEFKVLNIV